MEIEFISRTVPCCRELFRQSKLAQEHMECVVSDVNDDIGKIAWSEAQICLKSKEIGAHTVSVGAEAEIFVAYLTEERDRVLCMSMTREFSVEFECGELEGEAEAQVSLACQGVQARAINPRKIALDLSVRAELRCFVRDEMIVSVSDEEDREGELQLLREKSECCVISQICEKSFVVGEQLPVTQEGVERLVWSRVELRGGDSQMIGGKALIKGGAELRFGFEKADGSAPFFVEQCIPFSVLVDSGDEDGELGDLTLQPTALYASLSEAINGGRVVELELHATAQASFTKRHTLDYIVDAFSTRCPLLCRENRVSVRLGDERTEIAAEASDSVTTEGEGLRVLAQSAQLLSYAVKDGAASASAAVSLLLQSEDGSYGTAQKLLSFEMPLPKAPCEIEAARIAAVTVRSEADRIELGASVCFTCVHGAQEERRFLSGAELDTDEAYDLSALPSLSVVRQGEESLWELAKRFHSSPEAIERLRGKYPMEHGLLLIPRPGN